MDAIRPIKKAQIGAYLADQYPHLFIIPVPLKVGIYRDLMAVPDRQYGGRTLQTFLFTWTRQPAYCAAVERGRARYGLDGSMHPMVYTTSRLSGGAG
jgi:sRNA-binding protein